MSNDKKGFTLIELLAVIVILAIIALIAAPKILDAIDSSRISAQILNNKAVVKAASTYLVINEDKMPSNIGDTLEITINELLNAELMEEIKDPSDKNNNCNGYVIVTKIESDKYDYTPHVKCGDQSNIVNNETDGLIGNYKFNNFEEPTENLFQGTKSNMSVDTSRSTIEGEDEISKYYIKPLDYLYSWEGIRVPNISVDPGKKYTLSMDILTDSSHNISWDANVTGGGYTGNDEGRDYLFSKPSRYTNVNNWEKIYLTAGVRPDMINPLAGDSLC